MLNYSEELIIFFMAAMPFLELHSAMPLALTYYKLHWFKAFFLCVSGNIIPIAPLYLFLEFLKEYSKKHNSFKKIFVWMQEYKREKSFLTEKYEMLGLMVFISIPLPLTGVWFGCLIAFILGMKFKYAFFAMSLGSIISGIIILGVIKLGYLQGVIMAIALIALTIIIFREVMMKKKP